MLDIILWAYRLDIGADSKGIDLYIAILCYFDNCPTISNCNQTRHTEPIWRAESSRARQKHQSQPDND